MIDLEKFNQMTDQEKYDLLKDMTPTIQSRQFMDGNKMVGDPSAIKIGHRLIIQNVALSAWKCTKIEAYNEGFLNLEALNQNIDPLAIPFGNFLPGSKIEMPANQIGKEAVQ